MTSVHPSKRAALAVWDFFAPRHTPGTLTPAARSAAISVIVVLACCLIFTPQLGLIGMLGGLTTYWENGRPLWARLRHGVIVTAGLVATMSVGVLVAAHRWAIVPASIGIILVSGMIYFVFMLTRGPSPVMLFYAGVVGSFFGAHPSLGWKLVGVTAFASTLATLLMAIPAMFPRRGPEHRAIITADKAVAAYGRTLSDDPAAARTARDLATDAVNTAGLTLRSAWPADHGDHFHRLHDDLTSITDQWRRTVARHAGTAPDPSADTREPITDVFRRPPVRYLVRRAFNRHSIEWFTTWRMALAAGIAGIVSELCGIGHPYWAIITGTIIINQWMDRRTSTRRAAHRTVGTLLGVGVVGLVALLDPTPWGGVAVVIACLIGQFLAFQLNYALALVFITPMALIAIETSDGGAISYGQLVSDRFLDTIIGALAALAVTYATSYWFPRRIIRDQSARANAAIARVHSARAQAARVGAAHGTPDRTGLAEDALVELQYELTRHMNVLEKAVADDPRLAGLAPAEHRTTDRGYAALIG
ncbi:FUSC family protein [Gordonia hydrophobica]|uniref:FUSC family protein n=1 Tax=Gordonia hydrophobica TaxID=40516 RepID=A0ABZ2U5X2_9ACTN|nr:FUSC family protein [Gordonia hydrophobica]MBM7365720.1 hypothetical protein [Gordonia hydrophobica]